MGPTDGEIAAMVDPVLRNLCITQRYHEFATALRDAGLGDDATWCAFAVWASKTAGATIRGHMLPARVMEIVRADEASHSVLGRFNEKMAGKAMRELTHDHLGRLIEGVTKDVSKHLAEGNLLVFAELAPVFTALLAAHDADPAPATPEALGAALAPALTALDADADGASAVAAFGSYGRALFAPADRAALILQANILAVSHEQRRLQTAISAALHAPISDTLQAMIANDIVRHLPTGELRRLLDKMTEDLCAVLDRALDTALTEAIMQLITASETFDLREDVPPLAGTMFPAGLSSLTGTVAEAAYALWDKSSGKGTPSGAGDWDKLDERMNFIVNLFRSRQNDASLFDAPFSDVQLADLAKGQLPQEPL